MTSATSPVIVRSLDNQTRALELRRAGHSFRKIAAEMDCSVGAAHKYIKQAMEETRAEVAAHTDELRAEELSRLDGLMQRLYPLATAEAPDLQAVDRVLKCMERRARLIGLDAPVRVGAVAGVAAGVGGDEGTVVTAEARVTVYLPANGR